MQLKKLTLGILTTLPMFFISSTHANETAKAATETTQYLNNQLLQSLPFNET